MSKARINDKETIDKINEILKDIRYGGISLGDRYGEWRDYVWLSYSDMSNLRDKFNDMKEQIDKINVIFTDAMGKLREENPYDYWRS